MRLLLGALALQVAGWRSGSPPAAALSAQHAARTSAAALARGDPEESSDGHGGEDEHHDHVDEEDLVNKAPHDEEHEDAHDSHGSHDAHDAHGSHDSHDSHGAHDEAHPGSGAASVAVGMFSTTILVPFVFTLIQRGGVVTELMWQFIDMFVSVFLAILWFGAFSELMSLRHVMEFFGADPVVVAVIQVLVLYFLALMVAYLFRDNVFRLVTFGSCGAHYVAFAGIAAGEHTQRTHFSERTVDCFLFAAIAFAALGALFFAVYRSRRQLDTKLNHVIDEIEIDIAALVTSYLVTQAMRMWLHGEYPPPHLLLAAREPASLASAPASGYLFSSFAHEPHHTFLQRSLMLLWALFVITLSILLVPRLEKWGHEGVWHHRIAHFLKVLLIMCGSWGFLLWGEWEFHAIFRGDVLFGKMVFALLATMTCLFILMAIGYVMPPDDREHMKAARIGMTGLGLVAAWSWEHCFHVALDVVGEEYEVGYGGLIPKIVLAIVVPSFVLPVYVNYVKPIVLEYEHHVEEDEKAHP